MCQRPEIASEQMVEVVKAANTGDNLTSLLRELLSGVADADKDRKASARCKRKVIAKSHCAMLADSLFKILLSVEERKSKLGENFGKEVVSTIRTIRVFTDVSPPVVLRHLDTLLTVWYWTTASSNTLDDSPLTSFSEIRRDCDRFYDESFPTAGVFDERLSKLDVQSSKSSDVGVASSS
jgi:hypothetical protein